MSMVAPFSDSITLGWDLHDRETEYAPETVADVMKQST
jgi:hypothetical protein